MKKLRIFITHSGHPKFWGGGSVVVNNTASELVSLGHDVTVISLSKKELLNEKVDVPYRSIIEPKSKLPWKDVLKVKKIVGNLAKEGSPDVVISVGYEGFGIPSVVPKSIFISANHKIVEDISFLKLCRPKWINPLNWGKWLYSLTLWLDKKTKQKSDRVQALCKLGVNQLKKIYGIKEDKILVVPNGVHLPQNPPGPNLKQKTILFAGGSLPWKGPDIMIKAFSIVKKKFPDTDLVVLGELHRADTDRLKNLAAKGEVFGSIDWHGKVNPDLISEFYSKATICVTPSRVEVFPMVPLEAMAYGVPVIVTPVGAMPEIIEDGNNGYLMEKENYRQLADLICRLLGNPELAGKIGKNGRKTAENLTWRKAAEKYEKEILKMM